MPKKLTVSIIIPTIGRPDDLKRTLQSIVRQTTLPREVILVDASGSKEGEQTLTEIFRTTSIRRTFLPTKRGSCFQRNKGGKASKGDILLFLDDDVELEPQYLAELRQAYENDSEVKGATGYIVNAEENNPLMLLYKKLFLLSHNGGKGRLQASGYPGWNFKPDVLTTVEIMSGCNFSLRRSLFADYHFNEIFKGYSLMEDVELSYRLSRRFKLVQIPQARLQHFMSGVGREKIGEFERQRVKHHYFIWRTLVQKKASPVWYYIAELGAFILDFAYFFKYGNLDAVWGALKGWQERKTLFY
jgi:GT2 family glycosyltransferase